jgi:hypothetical protein
LRVAFVDVKATLKLSAYKKFIMIFLDETPDLVVQKTYLLVVDAEVRSVPATSLV